MPHFNSPLSPPLLPYHPRPDEALVVVDMQQDFMPGGNLGVPGADRLIPALNHMMERFSLVVATRDWHPPQHSSFAPQGGPWPVHAVAGSAGAAFARGLDLPNNALIWSKADTQEVEAFSAFRDEAGKASGLADTLHQRGVKRLILCGVALDICVKANALSALEAGFETGLFPALCAGLSPAEETLIPLGKKGIQLYAT